MVAEVKPHVFLSHVREDAERVERLAADLAARGIATWVDRHKIKPGERWEKAIEEAIREGAFFVACFSKAYGAKSSSYMNEELYLASKEVRRKPPNASWFIPLRLDECEVPDWPIGPEFGVRSFQWLDMFPDWMKSIERLSEAVGRSSHPRAAVFIDGDWLLFETKARSAHIDFNRLFIRLKEDFGDDVAVSLRSASNDNQMRPLINEIRRMGGAIEFIRANNRYGKSTFDYYDTRVSLRAIKSTSHVLVLISGDSDFVDLIEKAKLDGKTTIVIAFSNRAIALKEAADRFIDLQEFMQGSESMDAGGGGRSW